MDTPAQVHIFFLPLGHRAKLRALLFQLYINCVRFICNAINKTTSHSDLNKLI